MGKFNVPFKINLKYCLLTPWLPMLRVQMRSFFVNNEYSFELKPDPIIIDAGANIGIGSLFFYNKYKPKRLIAIEADKNIFDDYLVPNIKTYHPNIELINKALWKDDDGFLIFNSTGLDSGHIDLEEKSNGVSVKKICLDKLLVDVVECDLLKVDIEGAEFEVLLNSKEIDRVKNIYVEVEYQRGSKKDYCKLINALENFGFEVFVRSTLVSDNPKVLFDCSDIAMYIHIYGKRK